MLRFRYDWGSWDQNPKVVIDKGRLECNGIPLLKSRKKMRRKLAIELLRRLLASGSIRVGPQWDKKVKTLMIFASKDSDIVIISLFMCLNVLLTSFDFVRA